MRIGILGGGESGVGAALLANKNGDTPFVSDYGEISESYLEELRKHKVPFEEKGHSIDILSSQDLIIKSPGIPDTADVVRVLKEKYLIEFISEVEYAFRSCQGKLIGITGSNGKTTVTNLTHHILTSAGVDVVKGGNLGKSFARLVAENQMNAWYVIELSSFQLDDITTLRPDIGVIINITPDHLDRYDHSFELYRRAKWKITRYQTSNDVLLIGESVKGDNEKSNASIEVIGPKSRAERMDIQNTYLRGEHNEVNAAFAMRTAELCGVKREDIIDSLNSFKNDSHRMEVIGVIKGAEWINDSKATNVDAAKVALEAIDGHLIWIAGGVDKGNDYRQLAELVKEKVRVLICLGKNNEKLKEAFQNNVERVVQCSSMKDAIDIAYKNVLEGDTVLLSPACASFDLFNNYKDRGQQFAEYVNEKLKAK